MQGQRGVIVSNCTNLKNERIWVRKTKQTNKLREHITSSLSIHLISLSILITIISAKSQSLRSASIGFLHYVALRKSQRNFTMNAWLSGSCSPDSRRQSPNSSFNENIYKTLLLARRVRYFVVQELCPEIVKIMSMFNSKEQIVLESRELSCYCWKVAKNYSRK